MAAGVFSAADVLLLTCLQMKCGRQADMVRSLLNTPSVVSIGLIWESERPNITHVRKFVRCICTRLHLDDVSSRRHLIQCRVVVETDCMMESRE